MITIEAGKTSFHQVTIPCYVPFPVSASSTNTHRPMLFRDTFSECIPEYLARPIFVNIYLYYDDGNACPHHVVTYQYSHQKVERNSVPKQLLTPVPRNHYPSPKLHSCNTCPDVDNIRRFPLDEFSTDNHISLDTIAYNYKLAFYDRKLQAVVLPRRLLDGTYSKKMYSLIPFEDPN
ncbi:hypothetical protein P9112_005702 [Eukaryota sp. TZLM1-RC]